MWRATAKLLVGTTALGGGAAAATIASSDDPVMTLKLCTIVPLRLCRDSVTAATIAFGTLLIQSWESPVLFCVFSRPLKFVVMARKGQFYLCQLMLDLYILLSIYPQDGETYEKQDL